MLIAPLRRGRNAYGRRENGTSSIASAAWTETGIRLLSRGVPVRDEQGQIVCWAGISLDISALKRTEESLRVSETQARATAACGAHSPEKLRIRVPPELRTPAANIR